jgi:hypothetical protein
MFYELLEIAMIDFLHMSLLNSCGMAQWNQHLHEHQQGWKRFFKKSLTSIKNYNVHMFWPKMI